MKNLLKRTLALVLVLVMVCGYVPGAALAAEADPALPTATATQIRKEDLTFAMNFKADAVTDEQMAFYGDWYADFELTVNKDVTFDANGTADGWLAGQYDGEWETWHGEWMNVPFRPVTLQANTPLRIMAFAAETLGEPGLRYTYKEVYEVVQDFNCGVYFTPEFLAANPDLKVTLELKVYNREDEKIHYVIGNPYVFQNDFVAYNVQTGAMYNRVSAATVAAVSGQTVRLLKDATDNAVYILEGVTLDLNGYTLQTQYLFCTHDIVDDSAANTGLLKITQNLMMQRDNRQLPVKTAEGYRFFEVRKIADASRVNTTKDSVRYMFQPFFEGPAHESLLAGQATTGVTVRVRVSWTRADGTVADQDFTFPDSLVNRVLNSYNPQTTGYGEMFTLDLNGVSKYPGLTYQACVVSDTKAEFTVGTQRVPTQNQLTTQQVNLSNNAGATAVVSQGTKVDAAAKALTLQVTELENTNSNITLEAGESQKSVDVHVDGVAVDNTMPVLVTVAGLAEAGLNDGNLKLYHVEKGVTNQMTQVFTLAEVDAHNEFYYEVATGKVTMALATFSEITAVENEGNPWNGEADGTWYQDAPANTQVYEIFNANQLAQFGKLVDEGNTFAGKTVRLMMNINLKGDGKAISFDPIGFGYAHNGGQTFCGTFDGNGNTISGLYQNGWDMGADTYSYSTAGGGLFASVKDATIKNLTMDDAEIVMECIDMGVVVGYAQGNCTFENIVVKNSKLANYQRYTGGAIGEVSNGHHILKNVDVEATTTVSSLWGDFDASLGGIIGGKWSHSYDDRVGQNGHKVSVYMESCDVAARLDAYNDVTSDYQWYSYRRCGMLMGNTEESRKVNGRTEATASYLETVNCTVSYGDWVHYHYCEFTDTSSLEARYPWVRVEKNLHGFNDAYSNPHYGNPIVDGEAINATNHGESNPHGHNDRDGHYVEIVFNQLYGGGQGCYGGNSHIGNGVSVINAPAAVEKFTSRDVLTVQSNTTVSLGQLFAAAENLPEDQKIRDAYVYAYVSPVSEDVTARGTFDLGDAGTAWQDKTIAFTGTGTVTVTINDYFYCTPTTITVEVQLIKTDAVLTAAPVANDLTYTGTAQALVSGGGAQGGKLVYSMEENGEFTQTIPTATNVGNYTVYYKVQGDATHNDSAVGSVSVTIAKAVASCTVTPTDTWTYNGTAQALVKVSNLKGASVVFSLAADGEFTETIPATADAGTYTVYYKVLGNDNYLDAAVKYVTVTVHKADSEITVAPVVKQELTYNKEDQPLVDAGTATGGEIWYKVEKQQATRSIRATRNVQVDEDGFSPAIPTARNAGTYTVYYKVKGDNNHNDTAVSQVTVTVKKAQPVVVVPEVNVSYGSKVKDVVVPDTEQENQTGSFNWTGIDEETTVGNVGTNSFTATYIPEDTENYEILELQIPLVVQKADPDYTIPTGLTATYGQKLSDILLTEGFAWKNPSASVGVAGTKSFDATFTPADLDNFNIVDVQITVTVQKADPACEIPTGLKATVGQVLVDVGLPAGFTWDDPTAPLNSVGECTFTATYTPADTANYNTLQFTLTVNVKPLEVRKFDPVFQNAEKQLYKIGNQNTVKVGQLFKEAADVTIGSNVTVTVRKIYGATGTHTANATWTNGTLQFTGTGVVMLEITDNDSCIPTTLYLEVVNATNATSVSNTLTTNVVLLNDAGLNSVTVAGRNTLYGNGFTLTYSGNGQYLNNGLKQGIVNVKENGTLDNVRIVAPIYPKAYLYYGSTLLGDYVQGGPSSTEGDKVRYHYQLSAVAASENATVSNCYIYGGRTNIFANTGDVTVTNTILESGTVANMQIQSNSNHTITLEDVTTIQQQVHPTIGDTSLIMLGTAILVGPETTENPTIVLKGAFKQYNWVTSEDADKVSDTKVTKAIIDGAVDAKAYNHTINGKTASNLGIIFMNKYDAKVENETDLPYVLDTISMKMAGNTAEGQVCSLQNATESQIYADATNADRGTVNGWYAPQFQYSADLGGQHIAEGGDEHCFREGNTIHVMFPSGDSKELDLAKLVDITKYTGQDLHLQVTCKDEKGNAVTVNNGKVTLFEAGNYTVTYAVTDTEFYDRDGQQVSQSIPYTWDVSLTVSLKDVSVPDARFVFDTTKQKMGYYKPLIGDVKQYLPFLAGLQIYDSVGQTEYLRFDGNTDFNKVASITITGYESNKALVEVKLTDGGVINTRFLTRANSGGGNTYTGTIKTSSNTIYFVTDSGTSNKDTTTTAAYWYVDYYKFIGNNGVEIQSGQQTFNSTGSSASTPSGNFGTTIKYTVTFDANGGNCYQTTGYATSAAAAVTLPTPTRSGYMFEGWYTAASGGSKAGGAGESYTPNANVTLYAQWGKPSTVIYDANGGNCDKTTESYTGTALTLPTPTREGYWFTGWYDAAEGGKRIGDAGASYRAEGDTTLYAQWSPVYTVLYNANGGSVTPASAQYQGTALTLPVPTRDGYAFNGWYTAASGGTPVTGPYVPTANITLYAQWKDPVIVTYDAASNGGSCNTGSQTYLGVALTLPTPAARTGYTFTGWYTAASGGTKIGNAGASYTPAANITLYAQWTINSYTITVTATNATVKVNGSQVNNSGSVSVQYGAQVKVEVTYSQTENQSMTIKGADGTSYDTSFTMPAQNVSITATSSAPSAPSCVAEGTLVTMADGTLRAVETLQPGEELLVWNLETGMLDSAPIMFNDTEIEAAYQVVYLHFSDGTQVKVIYEHGFWDYDLNRYVYLDSGAAAYIGHTFAKQDGETLTKVVLTDVVLETEVTSAWSPVTAGHLCYFVNGMLSMPGGVGGLFNIFQVDPATMTYDYAAMAQDIETYGLFTYEEVNAIAPLPLQMFEECGGAYLKISIAKGNMTVEDLAYMINRYRNFYE